MNNDKTKKIIIIAAISLIVIILIILLKQSDFKFQTKKTKINNFKQETLSAINMASIMYTDMSMSQKDLSKYLVSSTNKKYKGMCITVQGLKSNNFINKDLENDSIYGTILVEIPKDGSNVLYSVWISNGKYGIQGYEKSKIQDLKYKKANNKISNISDYTTGNTNIITNLDGIKNVNKATYSNSDTKISNKASDTDSFKYTGKNIGPKIESFKSIKENGGSGSEYQNITCINGSLNKTKKS